MENVSFFVAKDRWFSNLSEDYGVIRSNPSIIASTVQWRLSEVMPQREREREREIRLERMSRERRSDAIES